MAFGKELSYLKKDDSHPDFLPYMSWNIYELLCNLSDLPEVMSFAKPLKSWKKRCFVQKKVLTDCVNTLWDFQQCNSFTRWKSNSFKGWTVLAFALNHFGLNRFIGRFEVLTFQSMIDVHLHVLKYGDHFFGVRRIHYPTTPSSTGKLGHIDARIHRFVNGCQNPCSYFDTLYTQTHPLFQPAMQYLLLSLWYFYAILKVKVKVLIVE